MNARVNYHLILCNAHSSTAVEFMTHHDAPAVASIMLWLSLAMESTMAEITGSLKTGTDTSS